MTREELKQEAEEKLLQAELDYCHELSNPCEPSELPYSELLRFETGYKPGYLASAEPREKRIAELEYKISILLSCKNCSENKGGYICQKEYEDKCLAQKIQYIKKLQEENKELKAEKGCETCVKFDEVKLTKAKELLKDITSSYGSTEVSEEQLYLKIKRAEQFLKECE